MSVIALVENRVTANENIIAVRPAIAALCNGNFTGASFPSRATLRGNTYTLTSQSNPWSQTPGGIGYRPRTGATGSPYFATLDPITIATGYTVCFSLYGPLYDKSYLFKISTGGSNGLVIELFPNGYFSAGEGPIGIKVTHYGVDVYSAILSSDTPVNKVCHCVVAGGTDNVKLWINGSYIGSATTGPINSVNEAPKYGSPDTYAGSEYFYGSHLQVFASGTRFPDQLARDVSENPYRRLLQSVSAQGNYFNVAGGGGATITAGSGSFALTGTAVSLKANRVLAAASGSFALTGSDVSLRVGRKLAADSGTYSLTGTDVAFKRGYALSAESGTYTLNGTDVSLKAGRKLTADSGTYALTGTNVTLTHNSAGSYTLVAESGSYSLTGTAVSLTVNRKLAADSGTYALTGSNATLTKGYTLTAASGTYTLTGSNVAFARTYRLTAESGAYTLTGSNASIVWSGAPVDSGPDTSGGGSGPRVLLRERKVREEVDEWLAKKAQADLLKKIQREDEEICLIMALLAA